jgi:hypothetical protein
MDVAPDLQISLLDEVKAQARVLVPLLQELRRELGEERADAIGPEIEFTRRNTIMKGAPYCDFRYRLVKR